MRRVCFVVDWVSNLRFLWGDFGYYLYSESIMKRSYNQSTCVQSFQLITKTKGGDHFTALLPLVTFFVFWLYFSILNIVIIAGRVVGGIGKILLNKGFVGAVGNLLGFDTVKAATDDAANNGYGFA